MCAHYSYGLPACNSNACVPVTVTVCMHKLSRGMTQATEEAYAAMQQVMLYCVATPNHGLLLAPEGQWSGCEDEGLVNKGMSDTTYTSDYC
jgi:hypothetical protein